MKSILTLLLTLTSLDAFADTKVIYFGGYGATNKNLECWKASAEAQRPGISFEVHGFPGGVGYKKPDVPYARSKGLGSINAVLKEIQDNPQTHFIIVGHSSGS